MGDIAITIEARGGGGCARQTPEGGKFYGCGRMGCPDCELRRYLAQPQVRGTLRRATVTHDPGTEDEIVDEYTLVDGQYLQARRVKGRAA